MKFVLVLLQTLLCFTSVTAARNPASEKICQKFLTKQKTSPLDPNNKRNFTRDENAEFECELVLQDQTLPLQIRSTIHEGMSWLAVRHCQAGLRRHRDVVRNLEVLLRMSPHHHNFALRAGYWSLDPYVNNIKEATGYLGRGNDTPLLQGLLLISSPMIDVLCICRVCREWCCVCGSYSVCYQGTSQTTAS